MTRDPLSAAALFGIAEPDLGAPRRVCIDAPEPVQQGLDLRGMGVDAAALLQRALDSDAGAPPEAPPASLADYAELARHSLLGDVAGYVDALHTVLVVRTDAIVAIALGDPEVVGALALFDVARAPVALQLRSAGGLHLLEGDAGAYTLRDVAERTPAPPLAAWLGGAEIEPWLDRALAERLDRATPMGDCSAVGLLLRVKPVPHRPSAAELRRLVTSGAPPPLLAAVRAWLGARTPEYLDAAEDAAVGVADAARGALDALGPADTDAAVSIVHARDEGECVWATLRQARPALRLRAALDGLDALAEDCSPTLGDALAGAPRSAVLAGVARQGGQHWWTTR